MDWAAVCIAIADELRVRFPNFSKEDFLDICYGVRQ